MTPSEIQAVIAEYERSKREAAGPGNCPHCRQPLSEDDIKRFWAQYCRSKVKPRDGSKPWPKHSDKAGNRCRCEACNKLRDIRNAQRLEEPPNPDALTWDALLSADPLHGYERLIRHEQSKIKGARRSKLNRKLASEKFNLQMSLLRERAQKEGLLDKVMEEAKARADRPEP